MSDKTFEEILSMVEDACTKVFPCGDFGKKSEILECATKIYVAQMLNKGGGE